MSRRVREGQAACPDIGVVGCCVWEGGNSKIGPCTWKGGTLTALSAGGGPALASFRIFRRFVRKIAGEYRIGARPENKKTMGKQVKE